MLFGPSGKVATVATDAQGSLILRNVAPGRGYVVQVGTGASAVRTAPVPVLAPSQVPKQSFYAGQHIVDGYQYLTTRDGTQLSIMVRLPGPVDGGPYPTVIEYSGYAASDPDNPQPSTLLSSTLGYATVGINIRGTGCSGGAFQFFETLQSTDGYDAIEAIAAQPWVLHHRLGMVGISYPGIAQLFAAQTAPPHLAAIAPLSVIDDTYRGTLYPGGILNSGFALGWAKERQHDAEAAPASGQSWAGKRINDGDAACLANQALRSQAPNVLDLVKLAEFYEPAQKVVDNRWQALQNMDSLAPATFVGNIKVPVFLAGAWDDEQTGPHFANMLNLFAKSPHAKFTLVNGNHTESLTPEIVLRWFEFIEFYVAGRIPHMPAAVRAGLPAYLSTVFGPVQPIPPDRFDGYSGYPGALAAYQAEPKVRVLFENGAGCPDVAIGAPCPTFETYFRSWPPPATKATSWYLDTGGKLVSASPAKPSTDTYHYSGDGQATTFNGSTGDLWRGLPALTWNAPTAGDALSYVSDPLATTTVMAGTGRLDMLVGASVPDVDLQVTLSEVRSDGTEYYVQTGWLRASHRKLDRSQSNSLRAVPTHKEVDAAPIPTGRVVPLSVELMPFAHVFHAGSRVRIIIDVPGGSRPFWKFDVLQYPGGATVSVRHGGTSHARITLPVIPGLGRSAPVALPPCPGLRGEPCRSYVAFTNQHS